MIMNLCGVMATLPTPFDQQQASDKTSLYRLVQFNIRQGIDGLYVGSSTDEAFVQSLSERGQVLEITAGETKGKIKLIAHVGCVSTVEGQQPAASTKRYGLDAASTIASFYYPFGVEEHYDHHRTIIDSMDGLSMVVYNIPALSRVKLTLGWINAPVTLPGADALKQTSGDLCQMGQIRREHPNPVLYNGHDEIFVSGPLAGVGGGIGSTCSITGWRYQGIVKTLEEGDIQTTQKLQAECNKTIDLLIKTGVFHGLKTVFHYMGAVSVPLCREPFGPVDEKYLPELRTLAQRLIQERG